MTILITGASGFLGGRLTQILAQRGKRVRILASKKNDLRHLDGLPIEIVYGRLEEEECLLSAVKGVNLIFHCAALSADWGAWERFYGSNVLGVKNLIQAASQVNTLERFLHVSTTDVYGYPDVPCGESHQIIDRGLPYNRSKGLGEKIVWEFYEKHGVPVTIIRPATIYGPRSKDFAVEVSNLIKQRAMPLIDGGKRHGGFIYIDNAVEGIIQAATSSNTIGKAYNLQDGTDITWQEYINALADGLGERRPWMKIPMGLALAVGRFFEVLYRTLHIQSRPVLTRHAVYIFGVDQSYPITLAKSDFSYSPNVTFEQGISETLKWLKAATSISGPSEHKVVKINSPAESLEKPIYLEALQSPDTPILDRAFASQIEETMKREFSEYYERRNNVTPILFNERRKRERRVLSTVISPERRRLASQIRQFEREKIKVPVSLEANGKLIIGYTENISIGGLTVLTDMEIGVGIPVSITFCFGDSTSFINISGQIIYRRLLGENGTQLVIGIKFSAISEFEKKILTTVNQMIKKDFGVSDKFPLKIKISNDLLAQEAETLSLQENCILNNTLPEKTANQNIGSFQRRKHNRFNVQLNGYISFENEGTNRVPCKIQNLSKHGMCITAPAEISKKDCNFIIQLLFPDGSTSSIILKRTRQDHSTQENYIYAGEISFQQEAARRRVHIFLKGLEDNSSSERRKQQRRRNTILVSNDQRQSERRRNFGIFTECISFAKRVPSWRSEYTLFRKCEPIAPARVIINNRELIFYGSKDYLGLAYDLRVKEAAIKAVDRYGTRVGYRALNGTIPEHEQLEHELADFKGTETAIIFSGGYLSNVAMITTFLKKDDTVFVDEFAHASIIDGCLFSGARLVRFRHNSMEDLELKIRRNASSRNLIIVDGVYSVGGDLTPLPQVKEIAMRYNIPLMLDDAHGLGVVGASGSGTPEHFNLKGQVDLDVGTMSASLGGVGGFIACKRYIADYLQHSSKGYTFTVNLPPATTAGLLEALKIIRTDVNLRSKLWNNVRQLKKGLQTLSYQYNPTDSAIISIDIGNEHATWDAVRMLEARGISVSPVFRPMVKRGESKIRLFVTASHSESDISQTLDAFREIRTKLELKKNMQSRFVVS